MVRIHVGNLEVPEDIVRFLGERGFEVVAGDPPGDPGPDDLVVVPACEQITSSLRHSLNNPLTAVLGYTQLLLGRRDLPDDVRGKLTSVREHGERVRKLLRPEEEGVEE